MKKFLSILLALTMAVSLAVPAYAVAPNQTKSGYYLDTINSYVLPYVTEDYKSVVQGQSTTLNFYAHIIHPKAAYISFTFFHETGDQDPVEIRLPARQGTYTFSWTWNASRNMFKPGNYQFFTCVEDINYNDIGSHETIYLNVVTSAKPATGLEFYWGGHPYEGNASLLIDTEYDRCTGYVMPSPMDSTSDRKVTYTSSDPSVILVAEQVAGYGYFIAKKPGTATITATCGKLTKSIPVKVETISALYIRKPNTTVLCPGRESILDTYCPELTYVHAKWTSSDPGVVSIDKEGRYVCLKPGQATLTASLSGKTDSIVLTVQEHDPFYNREETTPTCTQEGAITGRCSRCDKNVKVSIPATGHSFGMDVTRIEPTATQTGLETGVCIVCEEPNVSNLIPAVFADTDANTWYAEHVDYVYDKGIMNGSSATTFAPDRTMTRAELVTVLYRIAGSPEVEGALPFTDVKAGQWYSDAVLWASQNDIVNGVGDNRFAPTANITREQIATILYRYSKFTGIEMAEGTDLTTFPDCGNVAGFALDGMAWAVAEGLITGTVSGGVTSLSPKATATRAQLATIISRYQQMFTGDEA